MGRLKLKTNVILILVFLVQNLFGQIYQFKEYSIEEGLSHPFVYTVSEDNDGFIWIGTGEGLCKFDGFEFKVSEEDDSLTSGFVSSSYLDSKGMLWFGHNSGEVTYYDGIEFKLLDLAKEFNSTITDISEDEQGAVYIASQSSGLIRVDKDFKVAIFSDEFTDNLIYSILPVGDFQFLIGTGDGLALYTLKQNQFIQDYSVEELEYISIQSINKSHDSKSFWVGTEDSGFYLFKSKDENFESYEIINMGKKYDLAYDNVQSVFEDNENVVWISTSGKGVFKLIPEDNTEFNYSKVVHYSTLNGLSDNFVKTVFQDWEGNFWIATYGKGIAFLVDETFTMHYQNIDEFNGNILSIAESKDFLWYGVSTKTLNIVEGRLYDNER